VLKSIVYSCLQTNGYFYSHKKVKRYFEISQIHTLSPQNGKLSNFLKYLKSNGKLSIFLEIIFFCRNIAFMAHIIEFKNHL